MFEQSLNIKFYENQFSGSRVVQCGQTDGRTDTTKLIFSFRNFSNASKNSGRICKISKFQIYARRIIKLLVLVFALDDLEKSKTYGTCIV
jgi:hypothetical protein